MYANWTQLNRLQTINDQFYNILAYWQLRSWQLWLSGLNFVIKSRVSSDKEVNYLESWTFRLNGYSVTYPAAQVAQYKQFDPGIADAGKTR